MLKVLFIGGTGNISTSVSKLCAEREIDLFLLNRGKRDVEIPGVHIIRGDITDYNSVSETLKDHEWDVVVNWIAFTTDDIEKDINLFTNKTKQYIFISSASAYQKPPSYPVITESTPLYNPYWRYSRDKIACEERLNKEHRENGFPVTIVRPSLTYDTVIPVAIGGWTHYNIIERMKKGEKIIVHGDGTSLWTITHAADFALGFVGLLGHAQAIGHSFHITSDELLTWNQIYNIIGGAIGVKPNMIHIPSEFLAAIDDELTGSLLGDKSHSVIFDNSKIKTFVPEFKAVIPFHTGIKKTLDWFEANPERKIISDETESKINKIIALYESRVS